MIKYELKCRKGHGFEGWFRNSAAYDEQAAAGTVTCPDCGSRKVEKAIMAPRVGKSSSEMAELRKKLVELRKQVEANSDNVGEKFAEEARKIHYGEVEARAIYGETTDEEAESLAEEGVPFSRIPWLPKDNA
jgi:hypothetical protein